VIGFLFWLEMNDRSNQRESWFDYKAKANGSAPVGKADCRSERANIEKCLLSSPVNPTNYIT